MRTVLLGICGLGKAQLAGRIDSWCQTHHHHAPLRIEDFEHNYLPNGAKVPYRTFLRDAPTKQFDYWRSGWAELRGSGFLGSTNDDTVLLMHGAIVRGDYGTRVVLDLPSVLEFQPDTIITLIDDVYDLWWRTEDRAKDDSWKGRPTLEQLIAARRTEQLVGDLIANHLNPPARHVVLSVNHPLENAARLILSTSPPHIVYLAFPISEPRRMLQQQPPNQRGMDLINEFHRSAFQIQKELPNCLFITPLAIDERPLSDLARQPESGVVEEVAAAQGEPDQQCLRFDRDTRRWPTTIVGPRETLISAGPPNASAQKPIPLSQVRAASGSIETDVGWRDYRLVLQADALAVCCPVMNNRDELAGGVRDEINFATTRGKPVYIYQDEQQDEKNLARQLLKPGSSAMGVSDQQELITFCQSMEDALKRAAGAD